MRKIYGKSIINFSHYKLLYGYFTIFHSYRYVGIL